MCEREREKDRKSAIREGKKVCVKIRKTERVCEERERKCIREGKKVCVRERERERNRKREKVRDR